MLVPHRTFSSPEYRYGFNGKEKDDDVKGSGMQYDYGFRIYDPRLGKFLSEDPLTASYPWYTPYQFAGNKPIWAIDLDGLEELIFQESFKPYMKGINQIIKANDKLIELNKNIQSQEKNHIKIFLSAKDMEGGKYYGAFGTTSNYTKKVHNYLKFLNLFKKHPGREKEVIEKSKKAWNQSLEVVKILGIENATDLSFDNEYYGFAMNTRTTLPVEAGKDLKRQSWSVMIGINVSTYFHEIIGHILEKKETGYLEHDNLFGFEKYSEYYSEYEQKIFKEKLASPTSPHPDSKMGKIEKSINEAVIKLKATIKLKKDNEKKKSNSKG